MLQKNEHRPYIKYDKTIKKSRPFLKFHVLTENETNPPILIGDKIGKLTAIEKVEITKWLCKCDCGKELKIEESLLINNRVNACDACYFKGKKFGELMPINQLTDDKWLCKCSCGTEIEVLENDLKDGIIKMCNSLTGQTFGNLIVSKELGNNKWKCSCFCKETFEADGAKLKDGTLTMCPKCEAKQEIAPEE